MHTYGDKRNYRKINIYELKTHRYYCSTTWSKTCREAIEHMPKNNNYKYYASYK